VQQYRVEHRSNAVFLPPGSGCGFHCFGIAIPANPGYGILRQQCLAILVVGGAGIHLRPESPSILLRYGYGYKTFTM
jgi:hypothetical protein